MRVEEIINNLSDIIKRKYGEIKGRRIAQEEYNIDSMTDFKVEIEYMVGGELYTIKAYGLIDNYVYSITKLIECECVDNRP